MKGRISWVKISFTQSLIQFRHIDKFYIYNFRFMCVDIDLWRHENQLPNVIFSVFYTQEFYNQTKPILSIKLILHLKFSKIPHFIYIYFELMSPEIFFLVWQISVFQTRFYYSVITSWRSYLARRAILARHNSSLKYSI